MCECVCLYIYIHIYTHTHIHIHIYIYDCTETVYELPLLPNNTAVTHFYTYWSGVNCWLDIYRCFAGLVVTGRIRDIGQSVLQFYFGNCANSDIGQNILQPSFGNWANT